MTLDKEKLDASPAPAPAGAPAGAACFAAPVAVKKGKSVSLEVASAFTGVMRPNPAKIGQEEQQYMEYDDTLYLLSPYKIEGQTTTVRQRTAVVCAHAPPHACATQKLSSASALCVRSCAPDLTPQLCDITPC